MAKLDPTPYALPSITSGDYRDFNNSPHVKAMEGLEAISKALPEGEYVGALLRWQVADGYAIYRVSSMVGSGTLQWIDWLDGYRVDPALIRGMRKQDIKDKVDAARRFAKAFHTR